MSRFASVLAAVAAFLVLAIGTAQAAPIGHILIVPGESSDLVPIRMRTSGGCPAKADAYYARAFGHGFPRDGQIVTPNTPAGLSHTTGFDVYFAQTMKDFAADNNTTLTGRYDVTVYCIDSFTLTSYGEFTGALEFSTPTRYVALGKAKPAGTPPPPIGAGEPVPIPPGGGEVPVAPGGQGAAPPLGPPSAADAAAAPGVGPGDSPEGIDLLPIILVAGGAFVLIVGFAVFRRWRRGSTAAGIVLLLAAVATAGPAARPAAAEIAQPPITIGVVIPTTSSPPTTEPPATTTTAPEPAGTPPPPVAGGGGAPGSGTGGGLSYTGSPVGLLLAAALALLAVGTAAVTIVRRKRHST